MMKKEIQFYRKLDGECPVESFLDSLPAKVAQKAAWVLILIEDLDMVPAHYFCELAAPDDFKKTQETPREEIEKAENFKKDYFQRKQGR